MSNEFPWRDPNGRSTAEVVTTLHKEELARSLATSAIEWLMLRALLLFEGFDLAPARRSNEDPYPPFPRTIWHTNLAVELFAPARNVWALVQQDVTLSLLSLRPDVLLLSSGLTPLFVEFDGHSSHAGPRKAEDASRDREILKAGAVPVRYDASEVWPLAGRLGDSRARTIWRDAFDIWGAPPRSGAELG